LFRVGNVFGRDDIVYNVEWETSIIRRRVIGERVEEESRIG